MEKQKLSRRDFLLLSGTAAAGTLLAACQPEVVERTVEVEKVVEQTVEVEVEKVVEVPGEARETIDSVESPRSTCERKLAERPD